MFDDQTSKTLPRLELNKWATRAAILLAIPVIFYASFNEVIAVITNHSGIRIESYILGDGIFLMLGYPLTRITNIFVPAGGLHNSDMWWWLPLANILFVFQWVIWSQLLVLIGRMFHLMCRRLVPIQVSPHIWPDRIVKADGRRYRLKESPRVMMKYAAQFEGRAR